VVEDEPMATLYSRSAANDVGLTNRQARASKK